MILGRADYADDYKSMPRVSGDDPITADTASIKIKYAPRERG